MFADPASLATIYPALVHHAITRTSYGDVMRFLGRRAHGAFQGEIVSDFKDRPEGVRVKHSVGRNSVKIYDKEGSVLRVETTVNDASQIQVVRPRRKDGKLARQSYAGLSWTLVGAPKPASESTIAISITSPSSQRTESSLACSKASARPPSSRDAAFVVSSPGPPTPRAAFMTSRGFNHGSPWLNPREVMNAVGSRTTTTSQVPTNRYQPARSSI